MNRLVAGAVAGAMGTIALNVTTYLDMLVRARPASQMPAQVAEQLTGAIGDPVRGNRAEALGSLLGYANGIGLGVGYAIARLVLPRPPRWLATGIVGGMAMAASDYPAVRLGITDPQKWSNADWAADVIPHAIYGAVTTASFDHMKK
jgi:hypothetical protein